MNAAFSVWEKRIAPVFDVAPSAIIVSDKPGIDMALCTVSLPTATPAYTAAALSGWSVGVLVCGAISRQFYNAIAAQRITIHAFVTGEVRELIEAWHTDQLASQRFTMPGCAGRNAISPGNECLGENNFSKGNDWGRGPCGSNQRRRTNRHGQKARPGKGATDHQHADSARRMSQARHQDFCLCPHCGSIVISAPGTPCAQQTCQHCHASLVRT